VAGTVSSDLIGVGGECLGMVLGDCIRPGVVAVACFVDFVRRQGVVEGDRGECPRGVGSVCLGR
jgi:hypothetical protein